MDGRADDPRRTSGPERDRDRRRRSGLLNHLLAYFAVLVVITPFNAWLDPTRPWFLVPAVGWGAILAVHVAWAMRLFDRGRPR